MEKKRVIASLGLALFCACAPRADAGKVETLGVGKPAVERRKTTGLSTSLAPEESFARFGTAERDRSFHSDIGFYETVLSYGPIPDPRSTLLLANAYIVANQQAYGIAFLETLMTRYADQATNDERAVYLSADALLRATHADKIGFAKRIPWVLETFDILEEAAVLSPNNPLVHWAAGLIYAQVPAVFGKRAQAYSELRWLVEHPDLEPTPGFNREAYRYLAKLHAEDGDAEVAARYQDLSGYGGNAPNTLFMGWFATTREKGLRFSPRPWLEEVVPERVFALRGFGFSDLHFVVSDDGQELISIDMGTQPYSMRAGYEYLREQHPELPELTTVFVTHAHWDHVGGYPYIEELDPDIAIYGRGNYEKTVQRVARNHVYRQFRGAEFRNEWVLAYKPDVIVDEPREIEIGDTTFEVVPVAGGETEDALLVHVPGLGVLFMGDALMPFYGEPWTEEGGLDEALDTIDEALRRRPRHILHGHVGITIMYENMDQLGAYRDHYAWLLGETRKHLRNGYSAKNILRLNLIPPGLQNHPTAFFGYIAARDHVINRAADEMVGIWREDITGHEPEGLDVITSIEYGRMLDLYLGLSADEVEDALERMIDGGDNELALQMAVAAVDRYPGEPGIERLKNEAADRLRSSAQYFDPFKFTTYTELIGREHPEVGQ